MVECVRVGSIAPLSRVLFSVMIHFCKLHVFFLITVAALIRNIQPLVQQLCLFTNFLSAFLQIPITLHKEKDYNEEGREVLKCGFKIGGGIDQDYKKSPQGYTDYVGHIKSSIIQNIHSHFTFVGYLRDGSS